MMWTEVSGEAETYDAIRPCFKLGVGVERRGERINIIKHIRIRGCSNREFWIRDIVSCTYDRDY